MQPRGLYRIAITGLALTLAVAVCGCSCASKPTGGREASEEVSRTVEGTRTAPQSTTATSMASGKLSESDARALEKQLDAIEAQLKSLGMPSDKDFKAVEDSLK